MPTTQFRCPACAAVLKTAGPPAGMRLRCPKCGVAFSVPEDTTAEAVHKASSPRPPAQPTVQTAAPTVKKRSTGAWRWIVGCLALVSLGLVGGILAAAYVALSALSLVKVTPPPPVSTQTDAPPAPAPPPKPADLLIGKWDGPDGAGLEFIKDGSIHIVEPGAPPIQGSYKLVGDDALEVKLPVGGQELIQHLKFQVAKDDLTTMDEMNKVDHFRRSGTAGGRPADVAGGPPSAPEAKGLPSASDFPGLLAYWKLDEGAGTEAADSSPNGAKAALHGGAWTPGVKGAALQFDGVGDYLDYGKSPALNFKTGAPFTFAGWVRTTRNNGPIVSQRNSKDGGADIDVSVSDGGLHATVRQDGGELGQPAAVHGGAVNDGEWRHFALTRDAAGAIELFLDGVSQGKASGAQAGGAITTDLRALGSERYWAKEGFMPQEQQFLLGAVDEFCVFGRALSADEIRELAGPPRATPKPPAVAVGPAAPPPDGPPRPPSPKEDMEKLQLTLPDGWKAEYQKFSQTWELEKYTPSADGLRESSSAAIDRLPDDAPATPDAYAEKLKEKDFQGIGYAWTEITEKKVLPDGFLLTGQVRDYDAKDTPPRFGLVMVRTIDGVKVRCSSGRLRSAALREEAMQILKAANFAGRD